jgi:hypothetical protein
MWRARITGISRRSGGGAAAAPLWRMIAFRLLALLAGAFFVLAAVPQALSPWLGGSLGNMTGVHDVNLHRWSTALAGWPDLGGAAVLFYAAWRPGSAALPLQWLALAAAVFLVTSVPVVGLFVAVIALPVVLVLVLYPQPRALLARPWTDGIKPAVLALGVLIAIFLLADAARALAAQVSGADELAANADWASNGEHLINVSLAALLAGMRRPGASVLGLMAGAVVALLGVTALKVPTNPGSWGVLGGVVAIVVGIALCVAVIYEWRRSGEAL